MGQELANEEPCEIGGENINGWPEDERELYDPVDCIPPVEA